MSKQLKRNEVVLVGRKQQLSKILLGQMKSEITRRANRMIEDKDDITGKIETLAPTEWRFTDGTLRSFGEDGVFRFTIEKLYGYRKLIYLNQNGLISAVYSYEEWEMLKDMIRTFYVSEANRVSRVVSIQKHVDEREEFERRVKYEVDKQLYEHRNDIRGNIAKAVESEVQKQLKKFQTNGMPRRAPFVPTKKTIEDDGELY